MSKKISELVDASVLDGTEQMEVVQGGVNKKVTINDILPVQLQSDKAIDLNGNELEFISLHGVTFALYPTLGAQKVYMSAGNDDDTGASTFLGTANSDDGYKFNISSFNGVNSVAILGSADNNSIIYTADTHTFNGVVITPNVIALDFADDAAAAVGGVAVGQWYHTSGVLKIRLS